MIALKVNLVKSCSRYKNKYTNLVCGKTAVGRNYNLPRDIGHAENEDESYDYAYLLEDNKQEYSFEVVPWDDVLGYALDTEEFEKYDKEYYAMLILWEITWFGYDEETIQNKMKSWNDED